MPEAQDESYARITGRYIKSDPEQTSSIALCEAQDEVGLDGGLNTYGYVGGNVLHLIDPRGLVEWTGTYKESGADIAFIGSKYMYFNLSTKCINGYKGKAYIGAFGVGASGGITEGPVSVGSGTVTVNDNLNDVDPTVFNGSFYYGGISYLIHGSFATVKIGGAKGSMTTKLSDPLFNGFHNDVLSFESVAGRSQIIYSTREPCCEN